MQKPFPARLRCLIALAAATVALGALGRLHPRTDLPPGPDAAVVAAAAWLAWAVAGYLLLGVVIVAGRGAHRRLAAAGERAAALLPARLRRGVELALGLSVAAVVATAPAASADPPAPGPVTASLDWPGVGRAPQAPSRHPPRGVVVRPGDSLWSIAADELGPHAPAPAVAARWPAWWAANRSVVGDDPALIHPGQRLRPPAPDGRT